MRVVIKRERPLRTLLLISLGLVAVGAAAVHFVHGEREQYDARIAELRKDRQQLTRENRSLAKENESLRRRVAVVERSNEIDSRAYAEVDEHLRALQEELQLVKEEVSFYQGIMSDGKQRGVRIQRFIIEPHDAAGRYKFRMVLTRSSGDDSVLTGNLSLSVDGERAGQTTRLSLNKVEALKRDRIDFKFRHFQRIEGELDMPQGFKPTSVEVVVSTIENNKSTSLRESFAWPNKRN